jgi:hypothetical protein
MTRAPISRQTFRAVTAAYLAAGVSVDEMLRMMKPVIRAFEETCGGPMSKASFLKLLSELRLEIEQDDRSSSVQHAVMMSAPGFANAALAAARKARAKKAA